MHLLEINIKSKNKLKNNKLKNAYKQSNRF